MSRLAGPRLVLDEMFSPAIATALRDLSHDVVAVTEHAELRAITDEEVFSWATAQGCWLLTENVKDFRPILLRALQSERPTTGILYTSSRAFPRSRKNPGPLIQALHAWLRTGPPDVPLTEDWLLADHHHVPISSASAGLESPSWARTDDIRGISEQRLTSHRPLGALSHDEREAVRAQLRLMIDI
jgi:predicted nuclease of predicted toxin-antitoxin system